MPTWHLTFSSDGRSPLFPGEPERRSAVHALARSAGEPLVLFCVVDEHVHLVVLCDQGRLGRLSRAVLLALRARSPQPLSPAHVRAVDSRAYMEWLLRHVLIQPHKHGLPGHPALWSGSCFVDLLGARQVPGMQLRILEALPRFRLRQALAAVGLTGGPIEPMADQQLLMAGPGRLARAAADACCADPALTGRAAPVVAARRAAVQLSAAAGLPTSAMATALELTPHGVRRLRRQAADPTALHAVRLRLALEERVATLPLSAGEPEGQDYEAPDSGDGVPSAGDRTGCREAADRIVARDTRRLAKRALRSSVG